VARVRRLVSRHDGWSQVAVVLVAVVCYELARLSARPDWPSAVARARNIAAWERRVHLGWESSLQRAALHVPGLLDAANVLYLGGNFVLTGVFFVWLYRRTRSGFSQFRDAFLIATAISLAIELRFPTAPPRAAGIGVEDTLRRLMGIDIGSPGSGGITDPVAAVPSLHAGWALGVGIGIAAFATTRSARTAGVLYPPLVVVTTIVTGNHFVVDALLGMAVVGAALTAVALARPAEVLHSGLRRGVEQSGSSPGS
jgi:hypothetical protein